MIYTQAIIYLAPAIMIFIVSWLPARIQESQNSKGSVLPTYLGPLIVMLCYTVGILLWAWDLHILPVLGWKMEPLQEERNGLTIHMTFQVCHSIMSWISFDHMQRTITGFSEKVIRKLRLEHYFDDNDHDADEDETDEP